MAGGFKLRTRGALPTLNALTFSNTSFLTSATAGSSIGFITGKTAGSVLTISPNDGRIAFDTPQTALLVGLTSSSAGTISYTITETLGTVTRSTTVAITAAITPDIQTASPGASWNGNKLSGTGGSAPITPRTITRAASANARPIAKFWTIGHQAFGSDFPIDVFARCPGGVASVKYYVEGHTYTVIASALNLITKANGATKIRDSYRVMIDHAACMAQASTGTGLNVYAEVTPVDPTMDKQLIGPLTLYPRSSDYDVTVSVPGTGANTGLNQNTILGAMNYLNGLGAASTRPRILLTSSATYDLTDAVPNYFAVGWCTIQVDVGITATVGVPTAPNFDTNADTRAWVPGWSKIEFKGNAGGAALSVDFKNFNVFDIKFRGIQKGDGTYEPALWFNGVRMTNTCASVNGGPQNNSYWNLGPPPAWVVSDENFGTFPAIGTDCILEYIQGFNASPVYNDTIICDGVSIRNGLFDVFGNNNYGIAHCYDINSNCDFYSNGLDCFAITYTGASATATVQKTGNGGQSGSLILADTVNGTTTIPISKTPTVTSPTCYTITQIVAQINATPGWHATVNGAVDYDRWRAGFMVTKNPGFVVDAWGPTNAKSGLEIWTRPDIHTEWTHFFGNIGGTTFYDNVMTYSNLSRRASWGTSSLHNESGILDAWIANNGWEGDNIPATPSGHTYAGNITYINNFSDVQNTAWLDWKGALPFVKGDSHNLSECNILHAVTLADPTTSGSPALSNSYVVPPSRTIYDVRDGSGPALSAVGTGNVGITDAQYNAMFLDKIGGNFLPALGSVLLANLVASQEPWDAYYTARSATDLPGPLSKNLSAIPAYPTFA